jgi:CheY-like chemotaxis protein
MSETFSVYVVDDDPCVLDIIRGILEPDCAVETFESVDACLSRLETSRPDMFLLDVRMPGIDGYAFCRQIKDDAGLCHIPVTFVSCQDTIDARLKGYDSGGEDFIVKPFEAEEMLRKVHVAQQIAQGKRNLQMQAEDAELLSSLVMASMDEYAILVQFMRKLITLNSEQEIAAGMLELIQRYKLDGVVQTRISGRTLTISAQGSNLPLETSVVDHARGMGRIFEFHSRSVHNFDRLTLMINNMPQHDPEFCGRLRDHLCIAVECAESRLKAVETEESSQRSQAGIRDAIERIGASTSNARQAYLRDRAASAELMMLLEQDFSRAFAHMEIYDKDELTLTALVGNFTEKLLNLLDSGEETHQAMEDLGRRLAACRTCE